LQCFHADPCMTALLRAILAFVTAVCASKTDDPHEEKGNCLGEFSIDGIDNAHLMGGNMQVNWNRIELQHKSGASLTSSCQDGLWDPNGFIQLQLLGKTVAFQVDLSQVGCGCNLAVYLIEAPGRDRIGRPSEGDCGYSPYYCDANKVCGQWCTEMDIMEANNRVFAVTPHKCDESSTPEYENCDRIGEGKNTKERIDVYGYGSEFVIDTRQPFEVSTSFYGRPSGLYTQASFEKIVTTLSQGGRTVEMPNSPKGEYLAGMADAMERGMSLRMTSWGDEADTMSWLDSPPCGEDSCSGENAGPAVLSNFRIFPIPGQPVPPAGPPPGQPGPPVPTQRPSEPLSSPGLPWLRTITIPALSLGSASSSSSVLVIALCVGVFGGVLTALVCMYSDAIKRELFGTGSLEEIRNEQTKRRRARKTAEAKLKMELEMYEPRTMSRKSSRTPPFKRDGSGACLLLEDDSFSQ